MAQLAWRKSSHSDEDPSHCFEVTPAGRMLAARDSEDPHGPHLYFTAATWTDLLGNVKSGSLDL
jgi:hypothetical protein